MLRPTSVDASIKGRHGAHFRGVKTTCQACPLKAQCIRKPDISPYRQVTFFDGTKAHETHPHTQAMKQRIDTHEGRMLHSRRLGIAEPVFGNLHGKGLQRLTLRSRRKVDAQWKLFAMVHNIEKLQRKAL